MNFRTTAVLLAILGALGAFYALVAEKEPGTAEVEKAAKMLVPGFKGDDVLRIALSRPREPTAAAIIVARPAPREKWAMESPLRAAADGGEADGMLSTIEFLEKKSSLADYDEKAVGLDRPRLRLEVGSGPGAVTIAFGDDDHTGKSVYARVEGQKGVALVASYAFGRLERSPYDLRQKSLFTVDRWSVKAVTLSAAPGAPAIELRKDGDRWRIDAPLADLADRTRCEDLVGTAHGLRAKSFPADAAELPAAALGLDPPRAAVTLGDGERAEQVLLGGPAAGSGGEIYARREGGGEVVTVEKGILEGLAADPEAWVSKALIPPLSDRIEALEVARPGAPEPEVRLVRTGEAGWSFAVPRTVTADAPAVDDLCRVIQDLQTAAVAAPRIADPANFGLDAEHALVVTLATAKERHGFRLGKPTTKTATWYAQREGRPAAYEVVFSKASLLAHAFAVLRAKNLLASAPADIARIDLQKAGAAPRTLVRTPDGWSTPPGTTVDAVLARQIAADLAGLTAERFPEPPHDQRSLGLREPWLTATVAWTDAARPAATLALGRVAAEGDGFQARLEHQGETIVFIVRRDLVDALERAAAHAAAAPEEPLPPTATGAPR